jgi:hypothetical protein
LQYSVRREDLYTNSRSSSFSPSPSTPDPELKAAYHARLSSIFGSIPASAPSPDPIPNESFDQEEREEDGERKFIFRLFKSDKTGDTGRTIVIRDKEEGTGTGAFLFERDRRFYFAEKATGERKRGFEHCAVDGEDVLRLSRGRNWGLEVPWRVSVIRMSGKWKDAGGKELRGREKGMEGDEEGKRKRPGKKRRIILRERKKKSVEDAEKRKLEEERKRVEREAREEMEREKRTKRNREKKVKRKMKEKMKKAGAGDSPHG